MNPRHVVNELQRSGLTQGQIVARLKGMGVLTTQATISRIGSGEITNPRFELGGALIEIYKAAQTESAA